MYQCRWFLRRIVTCDRKHRIYRPRFDDFVMVMCEGLLFLVDGPVQQWVVFFSVGRR